MDGVSGLDVLTVVLRVMPAIVPLAATALALVLWFRLHALGGWLRVGGQERLALYFDFFVANSGIVGAFFLLGWIDEKLSGDPLAEVFADMRLTGGAGADLVAGVSALLVLVYFAVALVSGWASQYFGETESPYAAAMRPGNAGERFAWVTVMSPTAGFCEEVIFRGILLSVAFVLGADAVIAVALTSLLFGLGHSVYGLSWTIGTTVVGAASAAAVLWSESLWPAIVAHTLYDMTVYYVFGGDTVGGEEAGGELPVPARLTRWLSPLR